MGKLILEPACVSFFTRFCDATSYIAHKGYFSIRQANEPYSRCPDPTRAFEELCQSLFDRELIALSDSPACLIGGLSVTCAPPSMQLRQACLAWVDWHSRIHEQNNFESLLAACSGIRRNTFERNEVANASGAAAGETDGQDLKTTIKPNPLDLIDVEMSQLEDLAAMRMLPHLVPYRRYIYIGETSLDEKTLNEMSSTVSVVNNSFDPAYDDG